jgi:L-ascorbate metabolism protein UlaG (beta-lactamase superfamily)
MDGKNTRRRFFKQLFALSAFSAGSILSVKNNIIARIISFGETKAEAMDNHDYAAPISADTVRIKYIGMSCFLITASNGTRIITDPCNGLGKEPADIVTVSCGHYYHCDVCNVGGFPYIYKRTEPSKIEGITFRGVLTRHLEMAEGQKIRPGDNYVICFEVDGIKVCHLGALGHKLSNDQIKQVGKADILMVPVGGVSTLPVSDAVEACSQLNPKIIIPMNYRGERSNNYPSWAGVDEFLKAMDKGGNVLKGGRGGLGVKEFKSAELPSETQVIVL